MNRAAIYLLFSVVWFGIAVLALAWKGWHFAALIAIVLGLFNIMRWLLLRRIAVPPPPPPTDQMPFESRNPDFDFELRSKELDQRTGEGP
ncbi:MAG: hypothetical protein ACJ8C4_10495 [Gemmataceae bacterium]